MGIFKMISNRWKDNFFTLLMIGIFICLLWTMAQMNQNLPHENCEKVVKLDVTSTDSIEKSAFISIDHDMSFSMANVFISWNHVLDFLRELSSVKRQDLTNLYDYSVDTDQLMAVKDVVFQAFVIGSLIMIGISHLVIYLTRKKEKSALFIAIACFALAIRFCFVKQFPFIFYPIINFTPVFIIYIDMISGLIAVLFYYLFIDREFNMNLNNKLSKGIVITFTSYILFTLTFPLSWSLEIFLLYQFICFVVMLYTIYLSFKGIKDRVKGALLNGFGIILLFLFMWNDVFEYANSISTESFIFLGALIYISALGIHLSRKSSKSFEEVEQLSGELLKINKDLELKVKQRTRELELANQSLKDLEKDRQQLLGNIAHELNTPLTYIKGYAKAIMNDIIAGNDMGHIRYVYEETETMAKMIDDLQDLYRIESNTMDYYFEDVEMVAFIQQYYSNQKILFNETDITFDLIFKTRIETIFCNMDIIRIKQVLNNLLTNAKKFTKDGGQIEVKLEVLPNNNKQLIKLSVIDNGIGIKTKDIPYLFKRFYQTEHQSVRSMKGSGLGLVITKEIIEAHHGKLGVESVYGQGSTFYFTLPIKTMKR